jgi:hypothetical protein
MAFGSSIGEGWTIFKDSFSFLTKKPIFLVPLFFCWFVVASITLYNRYYFPDLSLGLTIGFVFLMVFILAFSMCMANIVMLEMVQQLEMGRSISVGAALKEAIGYDLIRVIPIALIWSVVWFIILILKALTRKKREKNQPEPSFQDAGMTLSGMDSPFSFWRLGLSMLEKVVRMVVFLALPAVAWENKGPFAAYRKSFQIIKKHPAQFLTSYSLTFLAGVVMALPLLPIYILTKLEIPLPSAVWIGVIIYCGIIWTLEIYLEQMSVGILYLWHLKWEKGGSVGTLDSVKKPDFFDQSYELSPSNV